MDRAIAQLAPVGIAQLALADGRVEPLGQTDRAAQLAERGIDHECPALGDGVALVDRIFAGIVADIADPDRPAPGRPMRGDSRSQADQAPDLSVCGYRARPGRAAPAPRPAQDRTWCSADASGQARGDKRNSRSPYPLPGPATAGALACRPSVERREGAGVAALHAGGLVAAIGLVRIEDLRGRAVNGGVGRSVDARDDRAAIGLLAVDNCEPGPRRRYRRILSLPGRGGGLAPVTVGELAIADCPLLLPVAVAPIEQLY